MVLQERINSVAATPDINTSKCQKQTHSPWTAPRRKRGKTIFDGSDIVKEDLEYASPPKRRSTASPAARVLQLPQDTHPDTLHIPEAHSGSPLDDSARIQPKQFEWGAEDSTMAGDENADDIEGNHPIRLFKESSSSLLRGSVDSQESAQPSSALLHNATRASHMVSPRSHQATPPSGSVIDRLLQACRSNRSGGANQSSASKPLLGRMGCMGLSPCLRSNKEEDIGSDEDVRRIDDRGDSAQHHFHHMSSRPDTPPSAGSMPGHNSPVGFSEFDTTCLPADIEQLNSMLHQMCIVREQIPNPVTARALVNAAEEVGVVPDTLTHQRIRKIQQIHEQCEDAHFY